MDAVKASLFYCAVVFPVINMVEQTGGVRARGDKEGCPVPLSRESQEICRSGYVKTAGSNAGSRVPAVSPSNTAASLVIDKGVHPEAVDFLQKPATVRRPIGKAREVPDRQDGASGPRTSKGTPQSLAYELFGPAAHAGCGASPRLTDLLP